MEDKNDKGTENSTTTENQVVFCNCVLGARHEGAQLPRETYADSLLPNSPPGVGGVVILQYPHASHVAVILSFEETGIWIVEWNYIPCQKTERLLPWNDPHIVGFFRTK